jgi:hypothetical protein
MWVGAPDLHCLVLTRSVNIKWLIVQLGSDGLGFLMEVPFLSVSTMLSLDGQVSIVNDTKISVWSKFRNNVEWSLNNKSELLIEFSLLWFIFHFINIDDVPLLEDLVTLVAHSDQFLLLIDLSINFNDSSLPVGEVWSFILPHLPPSRLDVTGHQ